MRRILQAVFILVLVYRICRKLGEGNYLVQLLPRNVAMDVRLAPHTLPLHSRASRHILDVDRIIFVCTYIDTSLLGSSPKELR